MRDIERCVSVFADAGFLNSFVFLLHELFFVSR
jgi:hypothetical protein